MLIKKCSGRQRVLRLASVFAGLLFSTASYAWQQEYIVTDPQNHTTERYTWDRDHPPRYDDILTARIQAVQHIPEGAEMVSWTIPVGMALSTGPVAREQPGMRSVGWRVGSQLGDVHPWAQVSYNRLSADMMQQTGAFSAVTPYGDWRDITLGADLPINRQMSAWAALSQTHGQLSGEDYFYHLGVSARF